jgi:hypothetical protein
MTDDHLRALVREAVARHVGRAVAGAHGDVPYAPAPSRPVAEPAVAVAVSVHVHAHPSHARYGALSSGDDTGQGPGPSGIDPGRGAGPCLIEPAVPCNHCGYCQSHGH